MLRRLNQARRQSYHFPRFSRGHNLTAEILDDPAGLLDHGCIRRSQLPAREIDRIVQSDPDVSAGEIRLRDRGERCLSDPDGGEFRVAW